MHPQYQDVHRSNKKRKEKEKGKSKNLINSLSEVSLISYNIHALFDQTAVSRFLLTFPYLHYATCTRTGNEWAYLSIDGLRVMCDVENVL